MIKDGSDAGYSFLTIKLYFEEPNPKLFEMELTLRGKCISLDKEDSSPEEFYKFLNLYAIQGRYAD